MKLQNCVEELLDKKVTTNGQERPLVAHDDFRRVLQFLNGIGGDHEIENVFLFQKSNLTRVVFITENSLIESTSNGNAIHALDDIERVDVRQESGGGPNIKEHFQVFINLHKGSNPILHELRASIPSERFMDEHPEQIPTAMEDFEEFKRLCQKLFSVTNRPR